MRSASTGLSSAPPAGRMFSGTTSTRRFARPPRGTRARQPICLPALPDLRLRLEEAGLHGSVQFYENDQVGNILSSATSQFGDILLESLLCSNRRSWRRPPKRCKDIQKFLAVAGTSPTAAVDRLAEFAADITTAFNKLTGQSVFAHLESFRRDRADGLRGSFACARRQPGRATPRHADARILDPAPHAPRSS